MNNLERYRDRGAIPLSLAVSACCAAFIVHIMASIPLAVSLNLSSPAGKFICLSVTALCGIGPAVMFALMFMQAASTSAVQGLYGLRAAQPLKTDFSKARALVYQDDIDGAIKEYRRRFQETPDDPEGLFQAAKLLQEEKRFAEAADTLREILKRFKDQNEVWVRAAFYLGELYEGPLDDKRTTAYLFREIVKRAPKSMYGSMAQARLDD
ncbi:MAG TPA: tetratricopeptide repeat protein [Candidatus Bathyarchaeia archaeon]|nr:tetratricopeptide repeat protein [Candidatus Bathyarchaeia archaeon]